MDTLRWDDLKFEIIDPEVAASSVDLHAHGTVRELPEADDLVVNESAAAEG